MNQDAADGEKGRRGRMAWNDVGCSLVGSRWPATLPSKSSVMERLPTSSPAIETQIWAVTRLVFDRVGVWDVRETKNKKLLDGCL